MIKIIAATALILGLWATPVKAQIGFSINRDGLYIWNSKRRGTTYKCKRHWHGNRGHRHCIRKRDSWRKHERKRYHYRDNYRTDD